MRTQVRDWKPGYVCAWRVRNSPRETSFRVSDKQFVAQEANARRDIQRCCLLQRSSAIYQRSSAVISGYQRRARSYHLTAPSGRRCSEACRCSEEIGARATRPRSVALKNSRRHRLTSTALPLEQARGHAVPDGGRVIELRPLNAMEALPSRLANPSI